MAVSQSKNIESKNHSAIVRAWNIPISLKFSVEIGNYIKYQKISTAKDLLNLAISMEKPVPFKRFNRDLGHKSGIASC